MVAKVKNDMKRELGIDSDESFDQSEENSDSAIDIVDVFNMKATENQGCN